MDQMIKNREQMLANLTFVTSRTFLRCGEFVRRESVKLQYNERLAMKARLGRRQMYVKICT